MIWKVFKRKRGGRKMKAMYINAPGEVEIKDIEMPVRKKVKYY